MPHGAVSIKWDKDVATISVYGPFNISGVELADKKIRQNIENKGCEIWYRLDVLDENTLGCPDVMKVIGRSYLWSVNDATCHAVVVVCANGVQSSMMQKFIEHYKLPIKSFRSQEEAMHYLDGVKQ